MSALHRRKFVNDRNAAPEAAPAAAPKPAPQRKGRAK